MILQNVMQFTLLSSQKVSQETLLPGDRVIINGFLQAEKTDEDDEDFIGIVDPFLPYQRIYPGTKFYLCLKPNSVTGMRHHWKHPLFCEKEKRQNLIEWFEAQVGRRT